MYFDDSTQKVLLSLLSVFVGWFLAQGTGLINEWWQTRKIKKALLTELKDIRNKLSMSEYNCVRLLHLYARRRLEGTSETPLTNHIYSKFYSDISFKLNQNQRTSLEMIHGYIPTLNKTNDFIIESAIAFTKEKNDKNFEIWGRALMGRFLDIRKLIWHIDYHLENQKNPEYKDIILMTHKGFSEAREQDEALMEEIMEKAKSLNVEEFERFYSEKRIKYFD